MGSHSRRIHSVSVILSLKRKQETEAEQKIVNREGMADLRETTFENHPFRCGFSGTHKDT